VDRPRLYLDSRMDSCEELLFAGGKAAVYSARSPAKESANEDSAALVPYGLRSGILVVADGAGGAPSGAVASRLTVEALCRALAAGASEGLDLRPAVINGIEEANRVVRELGVGAATTVAIVQVRDDHLRPIHVGDT